MPTPGNGVLSRPRRFNPQARSTLYSESNRSQRTERLVAGWFARQPQRCVMMPWYYYLAHFFAGALLANGVPHFVQGISGNKFQTPFASPPGRGESSAVVNVFWGWLNIVVGAGLLRYFLPPLPPPLGACAATALGAIAIALWLASHFGKVRSNAPHP